MPGSKVAERMKVVFERDGAGWHVYIPAVQGCRSDGRSINEARKNIREALAVSLEGPNADKVAEAVVFDEEFRGGSGKLRAALAAAVGTRDAAERLEAARKAFEGVLGSVAKQVVDEGLSYRDAGDLLGVSHEHAKKLSKKRLAVTLTVDEFAEEYPQLAGKFGVRKTAPKKTTEKPAARPVKHAD
jgi:predicted RNase H-like HicB family nuclease